MESNSTLASSLAVFREEAGVDWDRLASIRQTIHQNAEPGFKEFKTGQIVRDHLKTIGITGE